jgi:hypothetical protein
MIVSHAQLTSITAQQPVGRSHRLRELVNIVFDARIKCSI